jgi:hypothetical protein
LWLSGGTISQLLNVHAVHDVRQTEIHTAEPSAFEVEMAMEKLKRRTSPNMDPVLAELIKAGLEQFSLRSINLLILLGIRRNCLRSGRLMHFFIRKAI